MALAIFDLDNTLLNGDSDHAWGEFLVEQQIVDSHSYQQANDYFYQQYQQGGLNIEEYLAFALAPLAAHPKYQLDAWHHAFMQQKVQPMLQTKAQALLQQHRQQGDYLLIITATNSFVTRPIGELLGVDDLLATEPEWRDGKYTGAVSGMPCFQQGKVSRLQQWLTEHPQHDLDGSYFYSDSHNDLPLLQLVSHPVAVDPDLKLARYATEHGWPILSLRD